MPELLDHFSRPAVLISTIDFYDFIPLSVTLTSARDHKLRGKANIFTSFSRTLFQGSE